MMERTLCIQAESPDKQAVLGGVGYTGTGHEREEIHRIAVGADDYREWTVRYSPDNGRSWSDFTRLDDVNVQHPDGGVATFPGPPHVDPSSGIRYRSIMKRFWPGLPLYTFDWTTHEHPFHDHVFIGENGPPTGHSEDTDDRSEFLEVRYEDNSAGFSREDPFAQPFLTHNRAYRGQSFCFDGAGGVYHPVTCRPSRFERGHTKGGVLLMRRDVDGQWHASNARFVTEAVSSRGMLEPDAAVLTTGTILIVCRGSDTEETAGRKWMTWSEDGGNTLAPIEEFRYASGDRFYSPSSIHRFIRSSKTGNLHWIGNICEEPPSGNDPRYPLYVGVIDEERMGLIKDSLRVIDTRADHEPATLSLSNFYLIEDRESGDIELYMTRTARAEGWLASVYRYRLVPY